MSKIDHSLLERLKLRIDKNGEPPDDSHMTTVSKELLESKLETIETRMDGRLARIEDRLDSKINEVKLEVSKSAAEIRSDMQKGQADLIKWVVGTAIALGAISITVMTFVLNNAIPKQINHSPQPTPIVIQSPPQQTTNNVLPKKN